MKHAPYWILFTLAGANELALALIGMFKMSSLALGLPDETTEAEAMMGYSDPIALVLKFTLRACLVLLVAVLAFNAAALGRALLAKEASA